jgi:predicted CXXCH cytochrome family protein
MNKGKLLLMVSFVMFVLVPFQLYSQPLTGTAHGDKSKLPKGCGSCHVGHGLRRTPMLPAATAFFCFRCHGDPILIQAARAKGLIASQANTKDLQKEFEKPYHHPIEALQACGEQSELTVRDPSAPRCVACVDCHQQHYVQKNDLTAGVRGVNAQGAKVDTITDDYELCFKCHSYSANLPADQTNKAELFKVSNPSYHPVIARGKNTDVPSLIFPLTTSSRIKCTSCHNNNDPLGPKGPHGSIYRYLLAKNFSDVDGSESPSQYELCYSCHRRSSILGNESFRFHSLHISQAGISCRSCHNPHGSARYPHLIEFDISVGFSSSGRMEYISLGPRAGQCYLTCHNKDHNPATYPSGTLGPSQ